MQLLASTRYSLTGQLKYNVSKESGKHWFYQMFVAYYCDGYSCTTKTIKIITRLNQILQKKKVYLVDDSYERLHIDRTRSKRNAGELEKLTVNDGDVTLTIKLKKAAEKNETKGYCLFIGLTLVC